jgi:hypothetical protein
MYSFDVKIYYKKTINGINAQDLHREPAHTDLSAITNASVATMLTGRRESPPLPLEPRKLHCRQGFFS